LARGVTASMMPTNSSLANRFGTSPAVNTHHVTYKNSSLTCVTPVLHDKQAICCLWKVAALDGCMSSQLLCTASSSSPMPWKCTCV
jgi:hypothetical protein